MRFEKGESGSPLEHREEFLPSVLRHSFERALQRFPTVKFGQVSKPLVRQARIGRFAAKVHASSSRFAKRFPC